MDNTQPYQSTQQMTQIPQVKQSKPIMKIILFIVLGIIIGAGIMSIFLFSTPKEDSLDLKKVLLENLQKTFEENFSLIFAKDAIIDIYKIEEEKDSIRVTATISLNNKQLQQIFEGNEENDPGAFVIFVQANYVKESGKWILKGEIESYLGTNLSFVIESLQIASSRAGNARISSILNQLSTHAEMIRIDNSSYVDLCDASNTLNDSFVSYNGTELGDLEQDIYDQQTINNISCYADSDSYCLSASLATDVNTFYCADSSGNRRRETTIPCSSANDTCSQ